jgi:hypothetical protein
VATESYWSAVVPEPVRILGLELKPFSAGHILLLHRTGNVFAVGGELSEEHLASAVFLCAQDFRAGLASLSDPETPKWIAKWRKKVGAFDLSASVQLFQDYIKNGSEFPLQYSAKPQKGVASVPITNLPAVHVVRCQLKHYYHVSEDEFWNMPWGLAQWDYFTVPVMEGQGDLVETLAVDNALAVADALHRRFNPKLYKTETASNG